MDFPTLCNNSTWHKNAAALSGLLARLWHNERRFLNGKGGVGQLCWRRKPPHISAASRTAFEFWFKARMRSASDFVCFVFGLPTDFERYFQMIGLLSNDYDKHVLSPRPKTSHHYDPEARQLPEATSESGNESSKGHLMPSWWHPRHHCPWLGLQGPEDCHLQSRTQMREVSFGIWSGDSKK